MRVGKVLDFAQYGGGGGVWVGLGGGEGGEGYCLFLPHHYGPHTTLARGGKGGGRGASKRVK